MTNYVQPGKYLELTAPYTVTSGQGAKVGAIFGVAVNDVTSGAEGTFCTEGVFDLPKSIDVDFAQGDHVFWDNTNRECSDTDSSASYSIGVAVKAALQPDATVRVKLQVYSVL